MAPMGYNEGEDRSMIFAPFTRPRLCKAVGRYSLVAATVAAFALLRRICQMTLSTWARRRATSSGLRPAQQLSSMWTVAPPRLIVLTIAT